MNNSVLSSSAQKVADTLSKMNIYCQVLELSDSTRTAAEAAQAVGSSIGQIVKSLIFKGKHSGSPILILVSGGNRVDTALISTFLNEPILRADPDFVREHTGFAIGGVPPVGFPKPITTLIDRDLLQFELVWAAAGTPHAVFSIHPQDLVKAAGGQVVQVC
jgi:prolyl-tRNA editing enzyme YbaK/EbsC (Cys-tRNA(Pro) deacylase)